MSAAAGPLAGLRVVEFGGLGPVPLAAMILADLGAEVVLVERESGAPLPSNIPLNRNRRAAVAVDLKDPIVVAGVAALIDRADILLEGFRPGVMEKLGLGPDACLARNERLIYGRMTGWGQTGPLSRQPGHDINYIAVTGALHATGRKDQPPPPPLNLVGDYGGGSMLLLVGVLSALAERQRSGRGQVVDAAMVEGTGLLMMLMHSMMQAGRWTPERASNRLDGAAPFYDSYLCADGRYLAVGALEPQFYANLMDRLGIEDPELTVQGAPKEWPAQKARLAKLFLTRTRDEWATLLEAADACVSPVLDLTEAARHIQAIDRQSYVELDGVVQPAPAPRFSRTPTGAPEPAPRSRSSIADVLAGWAELSG